MSGVGSRRYCDGLIAQGRVEVNGEPAGSAGFQVDPARDAIRVDGRLVSRTRSRIDVVFHKPRGMLVTMKDQRGRLTVASVLKKIPERVFPVGRLDKDSEGLLLLTNDGDLAHRVAHPSFALPKTYRVAVKGKFSESDLARLSEGVLLREGPAKPISARIIDSGARESRVELVLGEGRKREIRRMLARLGFEVESLVRVGLGCLRLGTLRPGEWRLLDPKETRELLQSVGRNTGAAKDT